MKRVFSDTFKYSIIVNITKAGKKFIIFYSWKSLTIYRNGFFFEFIVS